LILQCPRVSVTGRRCAGRNFRSWSSSTDTSRLAVAVRPLGEPPPVQLLLLYPRRRVPWRILLSMIQRCRVPCWPICWQHGSTTTMTNKVCKQNER
jgi:hypothetical protein